MASLVSKPGEHRDVHRRCDALDGSSAPSCASGSVAGNPDRKPILMIGYGNDLRSDNGADRWVSNQIEAMDLPNVEVLSIMQLTPRSPLTSLTEVRVRHCLTVTPCLCPPRCARRTA